MLKWTSKVALLVAIFAWPAVCAAEQSQDIALALRSGAPVPFSQPRAGVDVREPGEESDVEVWPDRRMLGELLTHLSWLSAAPKVSSLGMAERLARLLGSDYRLVRRSLDLPRALGVVATHPRRVHQPDGSLRLHFLLKHAAAAGTPVVYAAILDCSPQYQAKLTLQRIH